VETSKRVCLDTGALREAAAAVLRGNDRGRMTVAAPRLYPHQWSWDAAFVAVGLAHLSVRRAWTELEHLLAGQWSTGMIPHIVFDDDHPDYFPGPERWGCAELTDAAPRHPQTSGICQPPAHAIAVAQILAVAERRSGAEQQEAEAFARRTWPALYRWHRWLVERRRSDATGLIVIVHGWESGMDNSPRFDVPYERVAVGDVPSFERSDLRTVTDAGQRPSADDYDRYLWLIEEMRAARYDDVEVVRRGSFRVADVFMSAMLALASDVLADVGARLGVGTVEQSWLERLAAELREAVAASIDPSTGLAADADERRGERLPADTIAGFAPLLCGGLDAATESALLDVLRSAEWTGDPRLFARLPPSTSLMSARFDARRYWRGPVWPVMAWLFGWALARRGYTAEADMFRREGLRLVADGNFGEYYEPFTGEWLGSAQQSWTAAVTLDWLDTS
jgi:hypothetical protein